MIVELMTILRFHLLNVAELTCPVVLQVADKNVVARRNNSRIVVFVERSPETGIPLIVSLFDY